ncbi:hypothetical protein QUA43_16575 [Microcoleus sp. N9_B4]
MTAYTTTKLRGLKPNYVPPLSENRYTLIAEAIDFWLVVTSARAMIFICQVHRPNELFDCCAARYQYLKLFAV